METTTCTLKPRTLAQTCDAVYLLAEEELGQDVTVTYEASLDGGTTWEAVTPGELVQLSHTGDELKLRCHLTRPDESEPPEGEGVVRWFQAHATQEA